MEAGRFLFAAVALAWLQFCSAEDPAVEAEIVPVGDAPSVEVVLPPPSAGGTMVAVGPHALEVAPYGDGTVIAHVRSSRPPPPAATQLTVRVSADDGQTHPVLLVWDPAGGHYRGRLRRAHPAPGPIEVTVVGGGERFVGAQPAVTLVAPTAPAPVEVVVDEPPSEVVADVDAPRPSAEVVVEGPRPPSAEVVVEAPRPPSARVEVEAPRPPGVVVRGPGPPRPHVRARRRGRHRARVRRRRGRRARVRIRR